MAGQRMRIKVKAPTMAAANQAPCQSPNESSLTLEVFSVKPIPVNSSDEHPLKSVKDAKAIRALMCLKPALDAELRTGQG